MTAKTNTVRIRRRPLLEIDDFALVAATLHVKTAVAVTVFALQPLLGVIGMAKSGGVLRVTAGTRIRANAGCASDFDVLSEGLYPICRVLRRRRLTVSDGCQQ
jgi:hypothetical protein